MRGGLRDHQTNPMHAEGGEERNSGEGRGAKGEWVLQVRATVHRQEMKKREFTALINTSRQKQRNCAISFRFPRLFLARRRIRIDDITLATPQPLTSIVIRNVRILTAVGTLRCILHVSTCLTDPIAPHTHMHTVSRVRHAGIR